MITVSLGFLAGLLLIVFLLGLLSPLFFLIFVIWRAEP